MSMRNKTLYLHVGAHKTGSTILQSFLHFNRRLLNRLGYYYPKINRGRNYLYQHGYLASLLKSNENEFYRHISKYPKNKNLILSSECFLFRNKIKHIISKLSGLKKIYKNIIIILYVRRQDTWFESQYQSKVIANVRTELTFQQWVKACLDGQVQYVPDWLSIINEWESVFGKNTVTVRVFEKEKFKGGSIFSDFLDILGITNTKTFKYPDKKYSNQGFKDRDLLELLRISNIGGKFMSGASPYLKMLKFLDTGNKKYYELFSPDERKKIVKKFQKSNMKVATKYLGIKNGALFKDIEKYYIDSWKPYEGITTEKFIQIFLKIIMQNQKEYIKNPLYYLKNKWDK